MVLQNPARMICKTDRSYAKNPGLKKPRGPTVWGLGFRVSGVWGFGVLGFRLGLAFWGLGSRGPSALTL